MIASTLIAALFATGAFARVRVFARDDPCLTYDQAYQVASTWGSLISNFSVDVSNQALVENFTDYSESVNALINNCPQGSAAMTLPLLDPTFTNRTAFETGQGQQPPINFNLLQVFPGCGSVSFRWLTTNTAPAEFNPRPIIGLIIIKVVTNPDTSSPYPFLIDTVYSEFDSADWLQNLKDWGICNITTPACTSSTTSTSTSTVGTATLPTTTSTDTETGSGTGTAATTTATSVPDKGITAPAGYTTPAPSYTTSTSTDADGNVYILVTEVVDVYVTTTDVVTVTAS